MEEKGLKQFTFYDLYYESLRHLTDESAGRTVKNICRFMFTDEPVREPPSFIRTKAEKLCGAGHNIR